MLQREIPLATVTATARVAAGAPVLLNASPVTDLSAELLAATTIVVVNQGEAAELGSALDDIPHLITTPGTAGPAPNEYSPRTEWILVLQFHANQPPLDRR